jgi:serine/threonine-protein kinase
LVRLGLALQAGDNLEVASLLPVRPAISPDDHLVVYASRRDGVSRLYRRPLDQLRAEPIPGTEGAVPPFFSPDGQWIGFWADATLKKVALAGGEPIVVTSARRQAAGNWGDDDSIAFSEFTGGASVFRVPATGGNAQAITKLDSSRGDEWHLAPHILPGGRDVLYCAEPL